MKLINLKELRREIGSGTRELERRTVAFSITEYAWKASDAIVPIGRGKYGSAFYEFAIRLLILLLRNGEDITPDNCRALLEVINSPYFINNLKIMYDTMQRIES